MVCSPYESGRRLGLYGVPLQHSTPRGLRVTNTCYGTVYETHCFSMNGSLISFEAVFPFFRRISVKRCHWLVDVNACMF